SFRTSRIDRPCEKHCSRHRVVTIWLGGRETKGSIELDRFAHAGQRIQADVLQAHSRRCLKQGGGQPPSQSTPPKRRTDIQTLHLTDADAQRPQSNAACRRAVFPGEQQSSVRRRIIARQLRKLLVESLKSKVDPQF